MATRTAFLAPTGPVPLRTSFVPSRCPSSSAPLRSRLRGARLRVRMQVDASDLARQLADEMGLPDDRSDDAPAAAGSAAGEALEEAVEVGPGRDGMTRVVLKHKQSAQKVEIYEYGAAVTSFTVRDGAEDVLFLSDLAKFDRSKPIRGGIPICFPQFGPYGPLKVSHGFARATTWRLVDKAIQDDTSVRAVFALNSADDKTDLIEEWGKSFEAEYIVTLSSSGLESALKVRNTGTEPLEFTMSFHNYFKVNDVTKSFLFGFENLDFTDRLAGDVKGTQDDDGGAGMIVVGETDRIFHDAPEELAMFDSAALRIVKIKKTPNLADATVWNPFGAEGADPGWKNFVCIEPAVISKPAVVNPGEEWMGAQLVGYE